MNEHLIEVVFTNASYGLQPTVVQSDLIFVNLDGDIAIDLVPGTYRLVRVKDDQA